MKIYGIVILLFMWALTVIGMIYSVIAGIWQYKPFNIGYQNSKIFGTCFVLFIICLITVYVIVKWDDV